MRERTYFNIETVDGSGERVDILFDAQFFVAIRGVSQVRARVTDNGDGTWTVTWQPPQSGRYTIAVSNFGIPLPGSPYTVLASTPEPCPSKCIVRGEALSSGIAREVNTFMVSFKDKLGVITHAVDLDVFCEPVNPGSPRGTANISVPENRCAATVLYVLRCLPLVP